MEPGRRPLVLSALAVVALAVAIVWLAPASLVDSRLAHATRGAVHLANAHGTLWQGRGVVTVANAQIPIAWSMAFLPLIRGVVHMRVHSDVGADSPRGTVDARADGITLQDTELTVPAAALGSLLSDVAAGWVEGEVNGSTPNLRLAAGSNSGEARLVWRGARIRGVAGVAPLDLGDVRTTLVANGPAMSGPIVNDGGRVALRGDWALREKDALTLTIRVTPRNPGDAELSGLLSAVGTPDGDGWRIHWRLPLR